MYSIDLQKISLDEFSEILKSVDLLPGRRILLNDLDQVIDRFKEQGIEDLSALHHLLKKKRDYPRMAAVFHVSENYLIVLNREVNSYLSKSLDLKKLKIFSESEIELLKTQKILSTKDLYQKLQKKTLRTEIIDKTGIPIDKIKKALQFSDLIRINGVGPVFAALLTEMGISSVGALLEVPPQKIVENYKQLIEKQDSILPNLGLKDVLYCQRFARKLDQDIEW